MAYPIRCFEPGSVYFITSRCMQSRLLLRPSAEVERVVGAIIARALHLFEVDLFAATVMANHLHMLLRARSGARISDFVGYIEANIARRVGARVGWAGRFWHRRFSAEPVLDDDALVGRLKYLLAHGVKEGLVEAAQDWPGFTTIPELAHGLTRYYDWLDAAAFNKAKAERKDVSPAEFAVRYPLRLAVLPCWEHLAPSDRQDRVQQLLRDAEHEVRVARGGKPVLGLENVLAQDPHDTLLHTKRSPRPLCHASTAEARRAFRDAYAQFVAAYKAASDLLRKGVAAVEFPPHSFRPPLPWGWALAAAPVLAAASGST